MKRRIGRLAAVLAFAVVFGGGGAVFLGQRVAHAAPPRNVEVNCGGQLPPLCYTSVSAAIAAANPGDVVDVHPGAFLETSTINITVPLTLEGAGVGKTILRGDLNEEMINVTLAVPGILTVRGLTIEGNGLPHPTCGGPYVQVSSALPNDTIDLVNNAFFETVTVDPDHDTCFTEAYHNVDPLAARLELRHNQFFGFSDAAEFFDDSGPLSVVGNTVERLDGFGAGHVAFDDFACCSALAVPAPHIYDENTFAGYAGRGILVESNDASFNDVQLVDNSFALGGANPQSAVSVGGYGTDGRVRLTARGNIFHLTGDAQAFQINQAVLGDLKGNLLVGDGTVDSVGLDITTGSLYPTSLTIASNRITGFYVGLTVEPAIPAGGTATQTITAQQNCILDNSSYGAVDASTIALQASSNWWGAASGPFDPIANPGGMGNAIFGPVVYQPFLVASPSCP